MIKLTAVHLERMKRHAAGTYPEECCGALIGTEENGTKVVTDLLEIKNAKEDNRARRFLVMPDAYRRAEEEAKKKGLEIVGFYHSHPDHPARPSQFDLEHAMPWWSYIIISVQNGESAAVSSWVLDDDRTRFAEESLNLS